MSLINCPECSHEVSDSAMSCPNCGFELKKQHQSKKPKKKSGGCLPWVVVTLVILALITLYSIFRDDTSEESPIQHSEVLAYNYAEDFVEKKLKSPSTAEFPGVVEKDKHIVSMGNGEYKITSWVDSQNSFGATIRTEFSCTIIFEGDQVKCRGLVFY